MRTQMFSIARKLAFSFSIVLLSSTASFATAAWVKDVGTLAPTVDTTDNLTAITTGQSVAVGHFVVVIAFRYNIGNAGDYLASCSDNAGGNTYQVDAGGVAAPFDIGNNQYLAIASAYLNTGLTNSNVITCTWHLGTSTSYMAGEIVEYSGIATSSWFDKTAQANTFSACCNITSGATGTLTGSNDLVVGVLAVGNNVTFTQGAGYTSRTAVASGTTGYSWVPEDKVLSGSTAAQTATGTWNTGTENNGAMVVTYQAAGGGGGATPAMSKRRKLTRLGVQ